MIHGQLQCGCNCFFFCKSSWNSVLGCDIINPIIIIMNLKDVLRPFPSPSNSCRKQKEDPKVEIKGELSGQNLFEVRCITTSLPKDITYTCWMFPGDAFERHQRFSVYDGEAWLFTWLYTTQQFPWCPSFRLCDAVYDNCDRVYTAWR